MADAGFLRDSGTPERGGPKKSTAEFEALGRSRGGFSTKVHVICDALGTPLAFTLTPGQAGDCPQAAGLLERVAPERVEAVLADRGYDSDALVAHIATMGAEAVIPPRKNRKVKRAYDRHLYKERKKVEWFISLLKQYRRVATRYEKTARNFLGFVYAASTMILLR